MITVRPVGGAKKSLGAEDLRVDASGITVAELLDRLEGMVPAGAPPLDRRNALVAINGADSSVLGGSGATVSDGDTVSIIPVIHGGAPRRITLKISGTTVQAVEVRGGGTDWAARLEELRGRHPRLVVQAVSHRFVCSRTHLAKVAAVSLAARRRRMLLSKRPETDLLMRLALTGQISEAIRTAGARPRTNVLVIAAGPAAALDSLYRELLPRAVAPLSHDNGAFLRRHFGISAKHLAAVYSKTPLEDILAERAAIL